jgi:hypothetical protein
MIDDYETPRLQKPVGPDDHMAGPKDAPVTLVEYGDYECPFCGQAHTIVKQIMEDMGQDFRFVFRNFPLTQIHPHAMQAALAAEAAGAQGKFWEMHDTLYENQPDLRLAGWGDGTMWFGAGDWGAGSGAWSRCILPDEAGRIQLGYLDRADHLGSVVSRYRSSRFDRARGFR